MLDIRERLTIGKPPLLYNGATGTFLTPHLKDPRMPTDSLNLTHPEVVQEALAAYVLAGPKVIQTNTFCANKLGLAKSGLAEQAYAINLAGAQIARAAAGDGVYVAGDIGPTGEFLAPLGEYSPDEFTAAFIPQVQVLLDGGSDVIHIETMTCMEEVLAAIRAVQLIDSSMPVVVTMTFEPKPKGYRTMMGVAPAELRVVADEYSLLAFGANCGMGLEGADKLMAELRGDNPNAVLVAKLNAGLPQLIGGETIYPAGPSEMAAHAREMAELGVMLIGACCGSTPEHIEAMAKALARESFV